MGTLFYHKDKVVNREQLMSYSVVSVICVSN
jgi:hypothetical protein